MIQPVDRMLEFVEDAVADVLAVRGFDSAVVLAVHAEFHRRYSIRA
jgi:hypothetical protein